VGLTQIHQNAIFNYCFLDVSATTVVFVNRLFYLLSLQHTVNVLIHIEEYYRIDSDFMV